MVDNFTFTYYYGSQLNTHLGPWKYILGEMYGAKCYFDIKLDSYHNYHTDIIISVRITM